MDARGSLLRIIDPACFLLGVTSAAAGGNLASLICAATPPLLVRLLWNEQTPPVFLACMLMQWIFTSCNVFYGSFSGYFPGVESGFPNLDLTMTIIMAGLVCQALGFATIDRLLWRKPAPQGARQPAYDLNRLRWSSVAFAVVALVMPGISTQTGATTFIIAILQFYLVVLALTVYQTFISRASTREMLFTGLTIAVCTVLCFGSRQSSFKEVILISLAAAGCAIRISPKTRLQQVTNRRVVTGLVTSFVVLFYAGVLWESQIKPIWRFQELPEGKLERISEFMRLAATQAEGMDALDGVDALMSRMNNMWQMSLTLERVPLRVPHADGDLTWMAIKHVTMPRFLFPGKMSLDRTNRLLAEKYLGIRVGENASVGIGYMTEFFVDFGVPGVFVAAFLLGMFLGLAAKLIIRFAPSREFGLAITLATLWGSFSNYEANLAKGLGAFVAYSIIFLVMAWMLSQFVRPRGTPSIATHPRWLERNRKWQRNSPEVPLPLGRLSVDR